MMIIRAVVFAISVSLTLLGSATTVADAEPLGALAMDEPGAASTDPGDPGFPPDTSATRSPTPFR